MLATIPPSPLVEPLATIINLSATLKLVESNLVNVPFTSRLPFTVTSPVVVIESIYASFQYNPDEPKSRALSEDGTRSESNLAVAVIDNYVVPLDLI